MNRWRCAGLAGLALFCLASGIVLAQGRSIVIPPDKALIIIRVPTADAVVKISDYTSSQTGLERMFFTPELPPGVSYSYPVEVSWTEDGVTRKAVRTIQFQPGRLTNVEFTRAHAGESIPGPKTIVKKPDDKKEIVKKIDDKKEIVKKTDDKKTDDKKEIVKKIDDKKVETPKAAGKDRRFLFTYAGAVKDLEPGTEADVWLPVAVSGAEQQIKIVAQKPSNAKMFKEKQYGNTILHFKAKANDDGQIPFEIVYEVLRREVKTDLSANLVLKPTPEDNLKRFLQPDAKVPISGKPLDLLKDKELPSDQFATAKVMYDVVNTHMKYSKDGIGWGQGDSVWACDSKFGNCSDFHSLFISMARGNKIPSKFEMGFPIPTKRGEGAVGGYHCWAWFYPNQKGWIPVDISEANRNPELKEYYFGNLTEDRVRFTTGRDINLEPRQKGPALNFFIYPYAEVDGKAHPQEKMERRFAYRDIK